MPKSNNLSGLVNAVSRSKSKGKIAPAASLISKSEGSLSSGSIKLVRPGETRALSLTSTITHSRINFGSSSSSGTTTSGSGNLLGNLLKQTASGGIVSALGGSLSGFLGIGSIVSGLKSLFGGGSSTKPVLPPLVQFALPASRDVTSVVGSANGATQMGETGQTTSGDNRSRGAYGVTSQSAAPFQYQSTQIAQAVKKALLNSSSLNDVIAEI
jgi:hypothetical protein